MVFETSGNTGNRNAAKRAENAAATMSVRCLPREKTAWSKAAQASGLTLTNWVIERLNAAAADS